MTTSSIRRRSALSFAIVVTALLAAPVDSAVSAAPCPYGCAGYGGAGAKDAVLEIRDSLLLKRSRLQTPRARLFLDRAVESLGWALEDGRWAGDGSISTTGEGLTGLRALRTALGRLYWGDASLRSATAVQQGALVDAMWSIALGRFNAVWTFVGEGGNADPALLWKAEHDIHSGEGAFFTNRVEASLVFIRAWQRLLGQAPCCY